MAETPGTTELTARAAHTLSKEDLTDPCLARAHGHLKVYSWVKRRGETTVSLVVRLLE